MSEEQEMEVAIETEKDEPEPEAEACLLLRLCVVIEGVLEFRGGVARTGDWIYEPNGAVHEATSHPEETIYLANVHGAIAFYGDDPGDGGERPIVAISDWRGMKAIQEMQKTRSGRFE